MKCKQLIVAGFHRSGTSMLTQELKNAGLFIGDRLIAPHISNIDGHFEDYDMVNFHEKILKFNHETWQIHTDKSLDIPDMYEQEMERIITLKNNRHQEWGFKDPRTALFLNEWYEKLDNPFTLVIYRHYEECVNSLLNRASRDIAYDQNNNLSFWEDPALAYKMWIHYNKKIIKHVKANPDTTIVISHQAILNGYPIIQTLIEKFGFSLTIPKENSIQPSLLSKKTVNAEKIENDLLIELKHVWKELEDLSIATMNVAEHEVVEKIENQTVEFRSYLEKLNISTKDNIDFYISVLERLDNPKYTIQEKIELINEYRFYFKELKKTDLLIEKLITLIQNNLQNETLYQLIAAISKIDKNYRLSEQYLLKLFSIKDKPFPYYYNQLAQLYLADSDIELAKFYVQKAIEKNPNNAHFYIILSNIERTECQYEKALETIDRALGQKIDVDSQIYISLYLQKADIYYEAGHTSQSKIVLLELQEKHPDNQMIRSKLKMRFDQEKIKEEAKGIFYQDVLQKIQHNPLYYTKLHTLTAMIQNEQAKTDLIRRISNHLTKLEPYIKTSKEPVYQISFVVDALPLHYYQAEILLFSLERFAKISKEQIVVQCLNRVDQVFLNFLEKNGYTYHLIEPYLDGKYCNKLQQLEVFKKGLPVGVNGVILLDTDMFVLEPLKFIDPNKVCAKTVDGPNPPLSVLKRIFKEAKIDFPEIIIPEWDMEDKKTFECNFNGGFYYVPKQYISILSEEWRKWASWLYQRDTLFDTKKQSIHTDQVSMAMALSSSGIPYATLPSNINCPIHRNDNQRSFLPDDEVVLLHYHREISPFGLLKTANAANIQIKNAIEKANEAIAQKKEFVFFESFKKTMRVKPNEEKVAQFRSILQPVIENLTKRYKIILHAGTPKTGTTSLQFFLHKHIEELDKQGIVYTNVSNGTPPKHQWMVTTLHQNNFTGFVNELSKITGMLDADHHTIILSSEGIFNHWWDFSQDAKSFLAALAKFFDIELWVWFRDPVSFMESYYKQNLKNPQIKSVPCYGQDMSLLEMMQDEWCVKHLDYLGFILDCENIFGKRNVRIFAYEGDIMPSACKALGISSPTQNIPRENTGFGNAGAQFLRVLNRYNLKQQDKKEAMEWLKKIEKIVTSHDNIPLIDEKTEHQIKRQTALGMSVLSLR